MFHTIWTTAIRVLYKNKTYTLINFTGLTIGLTLVLLVITYVRFETSYDNFYPHADRLYRITNTTSFGRAYSLSPPALATYAKDFFFGIEEVARLYERSVSIRRLNDEKSFEEQQIYFADSTLSAVLPLEFVNGDAQRVLTEKFTVLINEEMALKYFGNENPIGETLVLGGQHSFRITGVVKNFPRNAHLHFKMLVPYENMFDLETYENAQAMRTNLATNFITTHSYTYLLLKPGVSPSSIDEGMNAFIRKYAPPERQVGQKFSLMKVTDIHLHSSLAGEAEAPNSVSNLIVFAAVGLLTLLMACMNYINLTTAQSIGRVKEIAMRKILGSQKRHLILQFYFESLMFVMLSFLLAFIGAYTSLPLLNQLTDKSLSFQDVVNPFVLLLSVCVVLLVTLIAGGYPAYFVTQFKSVLSLKAERSGSTRANWIRKGLVGFQLSVALTLLTASFFIMSQLDFLFSRPLGFDKEQVISVPLFNDNMNALYGKVDSTFHNRLEAFRNVLEENANIVSTSLSSDVPGVGGIVYRSVIPEGYTQENRFTMPGIAVDYDFIKTYNIKLVTGRPFDRSFVTDALEAFIINESAVQEFGWPNADAAIGKTILREYDGKNGRIVGVVKDFHFDILTTPVSGMLLDLNPDQVAMLSIRFNANTVPDVLKKIEVTWNRHFPEKAFQYTFLDEQLAREYRTYEQFGKTIQLFTLLSIVICVLGVYGLVLFTVQRKVKEIGVRKVLGASTVSIMQRIYREFALLVALSLTLAVPMVIWFMQRWLAQFAYRTNMSALPFVLSTAIVLVVVTLTISFKVWRASMANPVHSLRSE